MWRRNDNCLKFEIMCNSGCYYTFSKSYNISNNYASKFLYSVYPKIDCIKLILKIRIFAMCDLIRSFHVFDFFKRKILLQYTHINKIWIRECIEPDSFFDLRGELYFGSTICESDIFCIIPQFFKCF